MRDSTSCVLWTAQGNIKAPADENDGSRLMPRHPMYLEALADCRRRVTACNDVVGVVSGTVGVSYAAVDDGSTTWGL